MLSWWRVFVVGALLWIASVVVTGLTGNFNLVPTVVLLGSFLVPVTAVIWYLHRTKPPSRGLSTFGMAVGAGVPARRDLGGGGHPSATGSPPQAITSSR